MAEIKEEKKKDSGIFREKSIERVSGPEQLNDYIRVTTPPASTVITAPCKFLPCRISTP